MTKRLNEGTKKLGGNGGGDVKYSILLKIDNDYYKVGKIVIRRFSGDNFYIPSQRYLTESNQHLDKVSWHASGQTHFKMRNGEYRDIQQRQTIQDTGFQEVVRDTILDFQNLPKLQHPEKLDVIFNIQAYRGPIQFIFSIVSGRLIVAQYEGKSVSIKRVENEIDDRLIGVIHRGLGYESDNADKLLQYHIVRYTDSEDLPTGRRISVPTNSNISRYV